ncbi:MAG TPA: hypothetical protein VFL55_24055 [Acetobacteraceae bacterium]|nr:hypothetical protein [Acetobacteraceae bacterium]
MDPDSTMRLVRLAATLHDGTPVDVIFRDGSGEGFALYWSHLLDLPLVLLSAPLRLVAPATGNWPLPPALHWAALAMGPIFMGLLGLAVVWACSPFVSREWRWLAALSVPVSLPILAYGVPGNVHHHVPLVIVAVMVAGWAVRAPQIGTRAGWRAGLWAGVGIWLSPETVPFSLMAIGGLGLAWLIGPNDRKTVRALGAAGPGMLLVSVLAFAVDPGEQGLTATAVDRISLVYVALALALCLVGALAIGVDRTRCSGSARLALGLCAAALPLAIWLAAFPAVLAGPEGVIGDEQRAAFFDHIVEMMPVNSPDNFLRCLLTGALAASFAAGITIVHRSTLAGYVALCAAATLFLGLQHRRFAAYPSVLGAIALPWAMTVLSRPRIARTRAAVVARMICVTAFLLLPHLPDAAEAVAVHRQPIPATSCSIAKVRALLATHADEVVLALPDETPALLFISDVRTVGSLYHRNFAGFMRAYRAWRSDPEYAGQDAFRATNAKLVLACAGRKRNSLVADLPQGTLFDRLNAADPPEWLEPIAKDPGSGFILYRAR